MCGVALFFFFIAPAEYKLGVALEQLANALQIVCQVVVHPVVEPVEHKADDLLNFIYLILMYQGFAITVRRFYDITGIMFASVILAIMGPMLPVLPLLAMVIPSRTK